MENEKASVLESFLTLEQEELQQYCQSIQIKGRIAQTVEIELKRGQSLWASKGTLFSYSPEIEWQLKVPGGASGTVRRVLSGEGIALTYVTCGGNNGRLRLTANEPGRIASWPLRNGPIICTRGSFLGALGQVNIDVTMAKSAGAMFFGGAGLFLQKLSGAGVALIHGSGDFVEQQLAPGEKIIVSTGNLAAFSAETNYGIRTVGGCMKMLFGREGIFMTELTGPGWAMLQTLKRNQGTNQMRQ